MTFSPLSHTLSVACLACAIEAAFGYPNWLFRRIGHPVMWIGALIARLDRSLNRPQNSAFRQRLCGIVSLAILIGLPALIIYTIIQALDLLFPPLVAWGIEGAVGSTLIAQRSLWEHVRAVHTGLQESGVAAGRKAVSMIVGRDPEQLDEAGVVRAAIESLAENFSDGIVAPLFWTAFFGLPGITAYKSINTADSMIGHLTPRHKAFGWASAKLDDLVNLPASRLSALWIFLAAFTIPGADPTKAFRAVQRDASNHRSPNAGWPEAAMAGALGLKLAGPRVYDGILVNDSWMGDGRATATADDLWRALQLYRRACIFQGMALAVLSGLFWL